MLINLPLVLSEIFEKNSLKEWNKKVAEWITKHKNDDSIKSVKSNAELLLDYTTARRYIITSRTIKANEREKALIEVDGLERAEYEAVIDGYKIKSNKYENEFKTIYNFENWSITHKEIVNDFKECNSADEVMGIIFKWTYGIAYFSRYSSMRSRLTEIRSNVKNSDIKDEFKELILKYLILPKIVNDKIDSRVEKELTKKVKDANIEKVQVQDVKNLISELEGTIKHYLNLYNENKNFRLGRTSRKYVKEDEIGKKEGITNLMLFLTLTTGRRPIELLKMSEFVKENQHLLLVSGLAKKRDVESLIAIPTLFTNSDLVLRAIEFLRLNIDTATMRSTETSISRKLYAYINDDWNKIATEWLKTDGDKFKKCRAIYVLALETLINQSIEDIKMSQAGFMSLILGHDEEDITTQKSYYKASIMIGNFHKKRYLDSISDVINHFKNRANELESNE